MIVVHDKPNSLSPCRKQAVYLQIREVKSAPINDSNSLKTPESWIDVEP
jgi:hypothetical protein